MPEQMKLYYNGDIITLEDELYAEAVLVNGKRIEKVGSLDELRGLAGDDVIQIDLKGKTLMPSFIDAHSHFSGYASSFNQVDLSEAVDFGEITEAIQAFIKKNQIPAGKWIQAKGYDQNFIQEKAHPTKELLDLAAPNNPVLAMHTSGHMGVLNSMGLSELGLTTATPDPEGGRIGRNGEALTGYIEEAAFMDCVKSVPMVSQEEFMKSLMRAQQSYASNGITTVQEGFVVSALAPVLQYLSQAGMMQIDLIGYMDIQNADQIKPVLEDCMGKYQNHIKIGGYKMFLDGSPQGRTAWMRTPYKGEEPEYYGYGVLTDAEVKKRLELALTDGMQVLVHCNGDAAAKQYMEQYELALKETGAKNKIRPVIIHAQLLDVDQLDKVKQLKMIPSFFVAHVYYWGDIHVKNFGLERASRISPAATAAEKGILYTFHQDTPVIEPNMLETIWCAVNRITKSGVLLGADERITPLEALKAVTKNAAYQYFEEDIKGTIKEGKQADLVILDKNLLNVDPMSIREIHVLETIKEGKTIYVNNAQKM